MPRLELCAALLLARLYSAAKQALQIEIKRVYLWSDSMITLYWINTESYLLKTFVSNRIAEIQNFTSTVEWRHVPTNDNHADLVSSGQTPREFLDASLWKSGPHWLIQKEIHWLQEKIHLNEILENRTIIASPVCVKTNIVHEKLIEKCGSLKTLNLVLAYVLRFIHNLKNNQDRRTGPITANEIEIANRDIICSTQATAFLKEIHAPKNGENINDKSRLIPLKPFLDRQEILRVGGRLIYSKLPAECKHQILLPSNHHVTHLIIHDDHERLKHAGTQATLYSVRELFWPLDGQTPRE